MANYDLWFLSQASVVHPPTSIFLRTQTKQRKEIEIENHITRRLTLITISQINHSKIRLLDDQDRERS